MVMVLDTSGSMQGVKMEQARKALKYCLDSLKPQDRFAVMNFATTVNKYRDALMDASSEQVADAKKWCDKLKATGGTAINEALMQAMALRSNDMGRSFTIIFFTDGQPTIGETNTDKIIKNVLAKNSTNTRIFTFGVGEADGIDAAFLDRLAESTRAVSTFIKPAEDIETKTASLINKISHPVLANLKLSVVGDKVRLAEIYPPELPDLFHGGQITVFGRYTGSGTAAIKLTGAVGMETKEYVYETTFAPKTGDDKSFVEDLWARRKVGYLLDQIRQNGEKKELIDEVTALAKKYAISTPYTSFLIVPDGAVPVASKKAGTPVAGVAAVSPEALKGADGKEKNVLEFAQKFQNVAGAGFGNRGVFWDDRLRNVQTEGKLDPFQQQLAGAKNAKEAQDQAKANYAAGQAHLNNIEATGVNLSCYTNNLKCQSRLTQTALRRVANRNCMEIGGVWVDEGYNAKTPTLQVKAQSDAYFQMLEKHPEMKEVFQLGNHLVWMAPSGTAVVIDTKAGAEKLSDTEIEKVFAKK
jgi:Ca-activated chloride channel family protein